MPLYEYQCHGCRQQVEVLVRGSEAPKCPSCGGKKLEKQFSVIATPGNGHSEASAGGSFDAGGMCGRPQCQRGGCQGFSD